MKFPFQKLEVYKRARNINKKVFQFLQANPQIGKELRDQLSRAALSVPLNISEGSGRFSNRDKRHYYVTARSSALECVACFDAILDQQQVNEVFYESITDDYASLTKMLFMLIKKMEE
ncbi:MAG: four helix bundle protein [Bacteroidia bacterium]|nr:four helix bundle protein [Bacteroidia bacterium]